MLRKIEKSEVNLSRVVIKCDLTFKAPITKTVVLTANVDQDQAAQNVQPDLRSTLFAMLKQYRQKTYRNLRLSMCY